MCTRFLSIDIRPDWLRVVAKEELGDLIERWIHDRGPSFDSQNVIDARCVSRNHQRQQFVPVTCQFSLIRLSLQFISPRSNTVRLSARFTAITTDNVWKQGCAEGRQSRLGC